MLVVGAQCVKDLFFLDSEAVGDRYLWMIMTSSDMVAVPLYAFILTELCRPGTLTARMMVLQEVPFVLLPVLYIISRHAAFYYADVLWAAVYGVGYAVWAVIMIHRYHGHLKQRFSYDENINLNWLRTILMSFFVILTLWITDCMVIDFDIEAVYLLGSLVLWMFICYFIYRHESVIDELRELPPAESAAEAVSDSADADELKARIYSLFEKDRIFLIPQLKLSDVAAMANSNRTYTSRFFNNGQGKTFYEFVNEYRVRHAMNLLTTTTEKLDVIAEQSGFNSRQSFHRVFCRIAGCTPEQYRQKNG